MTKILEVQDEMNEIILPICEHESVEENFINLNEFIGESENIGPWGKPIRREWWTHVPACWEDNTNKKPAGANTNKWYDDYKPIMKDVDKIAYNDLPDPEGKIIYWKNHLEIHTNNNIEENQVFIG